MTQVPHVALLVETSRAYGRGVLRGVKRYLTEHGNWSVFVERRGLESPVPPWLSSWKGDGILTRTDSKALLDAILRTGVPGVEMRPTVTLNNPLPVVRTNDREVGRLAARHFLTQGFQSFGCFTVDTPQYDHFSLRQSGFVETVEAAKYRCGLYAMRGLERSANWEKQQDKLATWVASIARPAGILTTTDQLGIWLLDACVRAGLAVPEDVAVVGVEDDSLMCSLATPSLSSVRPNTQLVGYQAAALLDRMMAGEPPPVETLWIDPLEVVVRQSSDVLAVDDRDVALVLRFIRERGCQGITVDDVARAAHMSRSSLERRMRRVVGRSPMAEIRRVQLNRVKQLLIDTELPLAAVADKAGFEHPQYMSEVFKKQFGQTPGVFRTHAWKRQNT